jgi:hypothetical protein
MTKRDEILGRMQESYLAYFKQHGPSLIDEATQAAEMIQERGGSREQAILGACMHVAHGAVAAALNIVADELSTD